MLTTITVWFSLSPLSYFLLHVNPGRGTFLTSSDFWAGYISSPQFWVRAGFYMSGLIMKRARWLSTPPENTDVILLQRSCFLWGSSFRGDASRAVRKWSDSLPIWVALSTQDLPRESQIFCTFYNCYSRVFVYLYIVNGKDKQGKREKSHKEI